MTSTQIEPQRKRFHWEEEETWVEQRQRLPWRIRRFFKSILIPGVLLSLVAGVLRDAEFTRSIIPIAGQVLQIVLFILIFLSQFILLFWFLARTRSYTIMPDTGGDGISFDDYRGQPEILEQADQIVTLLRGVKVFEQAGGEPLTGLLLEGPPGTGKTWLAQAISTEAKVPFLYMDASGLQAMFIGVGPMKVMGLFRKARKLAKRYGAAVIFLDEIDAVGLARGRGLGGRRRWRHGRDVRRRRRRQFRRHGRVEHVAHRDGRLRPGPWPPRALARPLVEDCAPAQAAAVGTTGAGHRRHQPHGGAGSGAPAARPLRQEGARGRA